ncbi:hypothetical protein Syun_017340 [Stephania yunnanensis]|uniref:Uncharacterized protein n=1 Tax=Stephania yunnanensis TaxID=152371 RepID=A0AAP0P2Z4_9MAGN
MQKASVHQSKSDTWNPSFSPAASQQLSPPIVARHVTHASKPNQSHSYTWR